MLDKLGYKAEAVSSGEEAVTYLHQKSADIILLDMIMEPGIGGSETYKRIKKNNPKQKAVIVSGYAETEEVKETQKLGAVAPPLETTFSRGFTSKHSAAIPTTGPDDRFRHH